MSDCSGFGSLSEGGYRAGVPQCPDPEEHWGAVGVAGHPSGLLSSSPGDANSLKAHPLPSPFRKSSSRFSQERT